MAEVVAERPLEADGTRGREIPPREFDSRAEAGRMAPITCDVIAPGPEVPGDSSPRGEDDRPSQKRKADDADIVETDSPPNGGQMNGKRKRHRRKYKGGGHHRKWKPYDKLTWEEKQILADRESKRYVHKRDKRFASGQAMAPYNTTQFLMEQHQMDDEFHFKEGTELDDSSEQRHHHDHYDASTKGEGSGSFDSSGDEIAESPSEEQEIFQEKDFSEAYENFHAERLQSMSKDELVCEHLALEEKVENLEQRLRDLGENNRVSEDGGTVSGIPSTPLSTSQQSSSTCGATNSDGVSHLKSLIQKLKQENSQLAQENEKLKKEHAAAASSADVTSSMLT